MKTVFAPSGKLTMSDLIKLCWCGTPIAQHIKDAEEIEQNYTKLKRKRIKDERQQIEDWTGLENDD